MCEGVATFNKTHFKGVARQEFEFGIPYMWKQLFKNRVVALGGVHRHTSENYV
jgi:hypothetical protein